MRIERERRGFDLRDCRERKQLFLFLEREREGRLWKIGEAVAE